jgi:hypothetical protein
MVAFDQFKTFFQVFPGFPKVFPGKKTELPFFPEKNQNKYFFIRNHVSSRVQLSLTYRDNFLK